MKVPSVMVLSLAAAAFLGCNATSGPAAGAGRVTLTFRMNAGSASMQATGSGLSLARAAIAALPLQGTNGTLTLDDVRLVVSDVRLKMAADTCGEMEADSGQDSMDLSRVALHDGFPGDGDRTDYRDGRGCEVAGAAPFFVTVPLEGDATGQIGVDVGPGTYDEVEMRTGAPNDSTDADLLATIRSEFADWPSGASMVVVGSFTPTDGDPVSFTVYFDARIKVEQEFKDNPLVVGDGSTVTVTVVVDPSKWFMNADGTVQDLSMYDFATTGEVASFGTRSADGCRMERD